MQKNTGTQKIDPNLPLHCNVQCSSLQYLIYLLRNSFSVIACFLNRLLVFSCVFCYILCLKVGCNTTVLHSWRGFGFALALLADWSLARPLEESKLWLLRRVDGDDWKEEKVVWLAGAAILVTLGTDSMLGARIRFGMLFRSMSESTMYKKTSISQLNK